MIFLKEVCRNVLAAENEYILVPLLNGIFI